MYLGRNPAVGTQKMLDSIESQFDGILTTFDLRYGGVPTYPTLSSSLIVSLGGVLQEPGEAYYVSSDKIVFSEPPVAATECWILLYSQYGAGVGAAQNGTLGAETLVLTGELHGPANFIIDPADVDNNIGVVLLKGGLLMEDKNITIGNVATANDTTANGGGITLKGSTDKTINWLDATDSWTSSEHIELASGKSYRINGAEVLSATALGSGVTSSSLTSVGTITSGTWQGSAINASYLDSTVVTTGDTGTVTSTMIADGTIVNGDISASAAIADSKLATISAAGKVSNSATTATNANTANAIVARDADGNFSAGTITATLNGNASTATSATSATTAGALNSTRTFALTGDVTGSVSSDLSSGVSITTSIAAGSIVNADVSASAAIADTKLATISTAGKVSNSATTATSANTASAIVARDASGNFSAGTITASLNGNASTATSATSATSATTATKLSSARTFALTGDVTGSVSSDLTSGASITTSIAADSIVNADVNASAAIAGTKISPNFGSQNIATSGSVSSSTLSVGAATGQAYIEIGAGATESRYAYIDLVGDTTYTDYGLRVIRNNTGANASSLISHRGTGGLYLNAVDSAPIIFSHNTQERARIDSSGRLLVGTPIAFPLNNYYLTPGLQIVGAGASQSAILALNTENNANGPALTLAKSRTSTGDLPGNWPALANDSLGSVEFYGENGNQQRSSASIKAIAGDNSIPVQNMSFFESYTIASVGTTNFTQYGAISNTPGVTFQNTVTPGPYAGTGRVRPVDHSLPAHLVFSTSQGGFEASALFERMRIDSSGRVGIGTASPAYRLQLAVDSAGKPSTNTWTIVSDERIKEEIELADLDLCYEAIKNIPLKRFKWKDEVYTEEQAYDRRKLGWIAQDVEAVFPKAVRQHEFKYNQVFEEVVIPAVPAKLDDDGNIITKEQPERIEKGELISEEVIEDCRDLNSDQIYAAMYGAIQKLISKVETLEAEVAALKG